jgi:hypothetical protein
MCQCGFDLMAHLNWSLQGKSGDGDEWVELKRHDNDASLATTTYYSVAYWPLVGENVTKTAYRQFRIIQHGQNAYGYDGLFCCGIELYGTVMQEEKWQVHA